MKKSLLSFGLLCLCSYSPGVFSYHPQTHEKMSEASAEISALKNDPKVLENLGLEPWDKKQTFQIALHTPRTIIRLIQDGANFEDSGIRSQYHFFDPTRGTGLFGTTIPSPDWALEDKGDIGDQNFSLKDAYVRLYKALTLPDEDERIHNFGLVFEGLGRAIHHLQDMAQPQHVRDDAHCDILPCRLVGKYNPSLYETYTNLIKENSEFTSLFGAYPQVNFDQDRKFWTGGINGDGKGIADFTNRNFLSAGTNFEPGTNGQPVKNSRYDLPEWNGSVERVLLKDLLGPGTCPPLPPGGGGDGTGDGSGDCGPECGGTVQAQAAVTTPPPPEGPPDCALDAFVEFYGTTVTDTRLDTSAANARASTLSIFDQDLKPFGRSYTRTDPDTGEKFSTDRLFALNRFNFEAAYPFLIPRAVAYSTGIINHFFRGRIEIADVNDNSGDLTIEVRNIAGADNPFENGTFTLYYDAADGTRQPLAITQNASITNLAHGQTIELKSARPKLSELDPGKENPLTLVYRGAIGQEDGIASTIFEPPLSGFIVTPSYTPTDGISGPRHIFHEDGQWHLSKRTALAAGNMDWKGWYINGRATRVLTWNGPPSRYFGARNVFGIEIYQNGHAWAVAPLPVLGVALWKDDRGTAWIVAICKDGLTDVLFRRPNTRSDSSAAYDPDASPEGWREIARFDHDPKVIGEAVNPWFFNGNGTEAQTVRSGVKDGNGWFYRLKISHSAGGGNLVREADLPIPEDPYEESLTCNATGRNADLSICSGDCGTVQPTESHRDRHYRRMTTGPSGASVAAVDYADLQPIVATRRLLPTGSSGLLLDETYDSNGQIACGYSSYPPPAEHYYCPSDQRTFSDERYERVATLLSDKTEVLEIDGRGAFDVVREGGARRTVYQTAQSYRAGQVISTQSSASGSSSLSLTNSTLYSLDLRSSAASVREVTRREKENGQPIDSGFGSSLYVDETTERTTALYREGSKLNQSAPSVTTQLRTVNLYRLDANPLSGTCDKTVHHDFKASLSVPTHQGINRGIGGMATDTAGNFAASQSILTDDGRPTDAYVTFLSNGSLSSVVSGGSATTGFFDIWLIR